MIKIAIDAMGGDNAPEITVLGAMRAVKTYPDIQLELYGDETKIRPLLKNEERIAIVHTPSFIDMGEKDPIKQIRNNKDSSLVMAMQSVKDGKNMGVVTAGPTQAVIVGAHLIIKKIPQMNRVALAPIIPSADKRGKILLDVGANIELKAEHMIDLAIFASITAQTYLKRNKPRIGLLNIGTEIGKGRELEKEAFQLLSEHPSLNFVGNIETKEMLTNDCDILLTDGFTGNMVMKTMEGVGKGMGMILKEEIKRTITGKIGAIFMRKNLKSYKKRMDASEIGGAMIMGINAYVVKAHGSSCDYAFSNAINQVRTLIEGQVIEKVVAVLNQKESA